jgi:ketosteroid isomerase-like protein
MTILSQIALALAAMLLVGCASTAKHDLAHYPFPKAQAELREVLDGIFRDAMTGNVEGVRASHLYSDKFTKFGGRAFKRMNIDKCIEGEVANVRAARDIELEAKDIKIDVFGDVAVLTNYIHVSYQTEDQPIQAVLRGTLVFLETSDGWKIVHEHVTPQSCFEQGSGE